MNYKFKYNKNWKIQNIFIKVFWGADAETINAINFEIIYEIFEKSFKMKEQ